MTNQPEALRVAQALELDWRVNLASNRDAIRLLRAQHAEIERLRDGLYRIATLEVAGETLEIKIAKEVLEERKP